MVMIKNRYNQDSPSKVKKIRVIKQKQEKRANLANQIKRQQQFIIQQQQEEKINSISLKQPDSNISIKAEILTDIYENLRTNSTCHQDINANRTSKDFYIKDDVQNLLEYSVRATQIVEALKHKLVNENLAEFNVDGSLKFKI